MLEIEIQKFGLTEKESKAYIALLNLGESVIQEIAKAAGINRVTTYNIMDSLMEKGLVKSDFKGKKIFFSVTNPKNILNLLDKQRKRIKEKKQNFKPHLKKLNKIYNSSDSKPKVKFFVGKEGYAVLQEEYLKVKNKHIKSIANNDYFEKYVPTHFKEYSPRRVKKGIKGSLIYTSSLDKSENFKQQDDKLLRESKFVPFNKFKFTSIIDIFDNKTTLASFKDEMVVILINDKNISSSFNGLYDYIWKNS